MAAADDAVPATPDVLDLAGFNIDDLVAFDLAADEFCDAYSAFVANADAKSVRGGAATGGWLAGLCGDERDGSREGSPDSGVTTDGPLVGDEAMSAYVAELERFLMEDGDGDGDGDGGEGAFRPDGGDGERVEEEELIGADDDLFTDLLVASDDSNGIVTATAAGTLRDGEEENGGGGSDVLAAREEDEESTSRKRARYE